METRSLEKVSLLKIRLKESIDAKNISIKELADITEISRATIYRYLSGEMEAKSTALYKLGKALGVSEMWLAGYDIPKQRPPAQQNNDALADAVTRARTNSDFMETIKLVNQVSDTNLQHLNATIQALVQMQNG